MPISHNCRGLHWAYDSVKYYERSVTMEKGYAGRIKNKGNQVVEAPFKTAAPKSPKVKTGKDLRAGKSGK